MPTIISATEARVRFGALLRQVAEARETYIVERGGEQQVVVMSIAEYESLIAAARGAPRRNAVAAAYALGQRLRARRGEAPLPSPESVLGDDREARARDLAALP